MEIIIGERSRALSRNKSKNHVKFRCSVMTFDHATEKGLCSRCSPSDATIVCVIRRWRYLRTSARSRRTFDFVALLFQVLITSRSVESLFFLLSESLFHIMLHFSVIRHIAIMICKMLMKLVTASTFFTVLPLIY